MEQLKQSILVFEAFAKGGDDAVVPFSLRILQPAYDEPRGYYCVLDCPNLGKKPFRIFGVDEEQACELSITFIRQLVVDQKAYLVDDQGQEVSIPEIPPEKIIPVGSSETDNP